MKKPPLPGLYVQEILYNYGIDQSDLAELTMVSRLTINELVHGKRIITESMALRFSKLTGTSPEFWLDAQQKYSLWKATQKERAVLKSIKPLRRTA